MLTIIAAAANNHAIGINNKLIWHLPDDFKRFKNLTSGNFIIMGRKTFESFPKPLPNRTHIVITRQKNYQIEGHFVVDSLEKALELLPKDQNNFIIGGGEIYKQSMDIADVIELTRVNESFEGDTFFPEIDLSKWKIINEEFHPKDEKHEFDFVYQTFAKKNIQ